MRSKYQITKLKTDNKKEKFVKNRLTEKRIKNCRGVKQCNDGVNRLDKESQRQNFRQLLGFKENEVFESKDYSVVKQIKKKFKRQKIIN